MTTPNGPTGEPIKPTRRSTLLPGYTRDWPEYFDAVKDLGPRETLVLALDNLDREFAAAPAADDAQRTTEFLRAADLGCGEGRDTREILRRTTGARRWHVDAIDYSQPGLDMLRARLTPDESARTVMHTLRLEDIAAAASLRPPYHLINASFALPFCDPDAFPALWNWIRTSLAPGGRFAGQLFGDQDEWACYRPKSHLTRPQVDQLLDGLEIERLDEVQKEGTDATGGAKWHHIYHIVARNPR